MLLTKRDLEIFATISRCAILTTSQLSKTVFKGIAKTTVLRRLRKLEKAKFIERIEGLTNYENAWALTAKGAEAIGYLNPKRHFHRLSLGHDVKLTELRLLLEDAGIARSWIPEHEIRSAMAKKYGLQRIKSQSVPDGIMGVSYQGIMESIAIELELHHKNKDRYRDIFRSYAEKRNLKAVWYLVSSESLGKHLETLWTKYNGKYGPWFLWSLVDDVLENTKASTVRYFDQTIELEKLFEPAHPVGFGVSSLQDQKEEIQTKLSAESQRELPAKVG